MATTRMMLQRQQGCHVTAAALLVAMCIVALSAMLAPAPLAVAAAAGVSAGLGTTSVSDAVGEAAATVAPAPTTPPAAGDNVVFQTFRDLCNRSWEDRNKACRSVNTAACAALDNKTKASLSNVTNSEVDLLEVAGQVLSGLDSASKARTTACILAVTTDYGSTQCYSPRFRTKEHLKKTLKKMPLFTKRRLLSMCGADRQGLTIRACSYGFETLRAEKCLVSFRQGKTTIEEYIDHTKDVEYEVEGRPGQTITRKHTRPKKYTVDCCSAGIGISDRCLCQMKKKLGNNVNTTIPCLKKKELEACK